MRCVYDNDLHIHSKLSLCSNDPEQTSGRILKYAVENGLKTVCLTDHFWDETVPGAEEFDFYAKQNYAHVALSEPLPQADGVKFLFGCETELIKNMTLGISKNCIDRFGFIVIPTTHFHMRDFTVPSDAVSVHEKTDLWFKRFNAVLDMDLPFHKIGIAHLTCSLIENGDRAKFLDIIDSLNGDELKKTFAKAAKVGVGIELNSSDMNFAENERDTILRLYKIAKETGCKFYFGSDAHHPNELDGAKDIFERAIDYLNLTEDDKFHL